MDTKEIKEWLEGALINLAFIVVLVLLSPIIIIEIVVRFVVEKVKGVDENKTDKEVER